MTTLDSEGVRRLARHLRQVMDAHRDRLLELDRAIGDGDLGLTMARAFSAAEQAVASADGPPGTLFISMGMAMAKAAPSTMGTLMATGFMRGGKAVADAPTIGTEQLAQFFRAFADGILERGKTSLGNKTVVDALAPAADALTAAAARGDALVSALQSATAAAEAGRDAAREMTAQHGKAAVFREQTVGLEDPGAFAGALVVRAFWEVTGD